MSIAGDVRWFSRCHVCLARHCVAMVSDRWLFCDEHWRLVPSHLKKAIHEHFQAKRRREFRTVVDHAIEVVARSEAA